MKKKVRFSSLNIGDDFEWGSKSLKKDGARTATSLSPKQPYVFEAKDLVTISEPDASDDDETLVPGFGFISNSTTGQAADPDDIYDAYMGTDKLN